MLLRLGDMQFWSELSAELFAGARNARRKWGSVQQQADPGRNADLLDDEG